MRGYELHEFFNFDTQQPSLKRRQMLPFYAFVGKLYTFLESVAGRLHLIWLEISRGGARRETTRLYRLKEQSSGAAQMKAMVDGQVVADSKDVIECKGYRYFPPNSVRVDWLERVEKTADDRACPHGVQFYDVIVGGRRHNRAAWCYEAPRPEMRQVGGRFGFWQDVEVVDA
jgi:uncharacterized protein (DUF427 family)